MARLADDLRIGERAFMAQVVRYASLMGWRHFHDAATNLPRACRTCHAPVRWARNPAGFPDLVLVRPPRLVFVELKSARGRTTPDQAAWLAALRACGQECHVWRPADWHVVEEVLR